jgi:hypothetical protein
MNPTEYIEREQEILIAKKEFPGIEIGLAYKLWKEQRGEKVTMLSTGDQSVYNSKELLMKSASKPCTKDGCDGNMKLESVCGGCVEGKAGYKSKWTCEKCLHRELLRKEYLECLKELSLSLKE